MTYILTTKMSNQNSKFDKEKTEKAQETRNINFLFQVPFIAVKSSSEVNPYLNTTLFDTFGDDLGREHLFLSLWRGSLAVTAILGYSQVPNKRVGWKNASREKYKKNRQRYKKK